MKNSVISEWLRRWRRRMISNRAFTDEIIPTAQRHFAEEFPNSDRVECPDPEFFSDLIRTRQLPGEALRRHLFDCSECLLDYQASLIAQRQDDLKSAPRYNWPVSRIAGANPSAMAFATLLLVFTTIGLVGWLRSGVESNIPHSANSALPTSLATPTSSYTPSVSPGMIGEDRVKDQRRSMTSPAPSPLMMAANQVEIDLETSNQSRGPTSAAPRETVLAVGKNKIKVRLPAGSPSGSFEVMLADPFGNRLASSMAQSSDGTILQTELKLPSVKAGKYLLCITRETEVPDCVPVIVVAR